MTENMQEISALARAATEHEMTYGWYVRYLNEQAYQPVVVSIDRPKCEVCGGPIGEEFPRSKLCSQKCRNRARYARKYGKNINHKRKLVGSLSWKLLGLYLPFYNANVTDIEAAKQLGVCKSTIERLRKSVGLTAVTKKISADPVTIQSIMEGFKDAV